MYIEIYFKIFFVLFILNIEVNAFSMHFAQLQYDFKWFDKENIDVKILCFIFGFRRFEIMIL